MDRHIAFVSLPAHGHVNPTLPVVAELVRRGWRVSYATAERFGPEVEKTGATLVPTAGRPPSGPGPGRLSPAALAGFLDGSRPMPATACLVCGNTSASIHRRRSAMTR